MNLEKKINLLLQLKKKKKEKKCYFAKKELTGPSAFINTSRTSSQPLNDKTSNKASIASPILSKLNRLGFALRNKCCEILQIIFALKSYYE